MNVFKEIVFKTLNVFRFFSRNEFFCILILLYILVLIIGTIEQKNFGIQYAQDMYFNSNFLIIFDKFPMLGGKLILSLIFISLMLRLLMDKWKKKKIGTMLLHVGVLFLLFGGFISSKYSKEGTLIIQENTYSNLYIRDDLYELKIFYNGIEKIINTIKVNDSTKKIETDFLKINIISFNNNCILSKRHKFLNDDEEANVLNRFFFVKKYPSFVEQAENRQFLQLNFFYNDTKKQNISLIVNDDNFFYEKDGFKLTLSKKKEILPFKLFLSKFDKSVYPKTNKAKNYTSYLIIENEFGVLWKSVLEMNKPLRINGYTFYQTSYLDSGLEKSTVLTVVEGTWRFYPYISIIMIFLGFLIHLFFSIKKILRE